MSKLIERLKKANHVTQARLGFGSARQEQKTSGPALVALASKADKKLLNSLKESGADGCIVTVAQEKDLEKALETIKSASPFPVGLQIAFEPSEKGLPKEGPFDLLVLNVASSPMSLLATNGYQKMLQIAPPMEDAAVMAIDGLPIDAVLLDVAQDESRTVQWLLSMIRLARFIRKPLLVKTGALTSPKELQAVRDTGIAGIAMDVADQSGVDELKKMREALEALPARQKREERGDAILPRLPDVSMAEPSQPEPEEPDEDEP